MLRGRQQQDSDLLAQGPGLEGLAGTEGSRRLVRAGQQRRVAKLWGKRPPPEQAKRPAGRQLDRIRHLQAANRERAWPSAHLALLGKLTDAEVAARTGRGANAVRVKRFKLDIPNPSGPVWTEDELALLGTAPDAEVAARIGRTEGAVMLKRCKLGIPHPEGWGWNPEQLIHLGTAPDEEVAALAGKTPAAVTRKRCLLGIPTACDRRHGNCCGTPR